MRFLTITMGLALLLATAVHAQGGERFKSPDEAVRALFKAMQHNDNKALTRVLGPESKGLVGSGDPIADANAMREFVKIAMERCDLVKMSGEREMVQLGNKKWPFPIPLVKAQGGWVFDTATGKQELINRRIGLNELHAIDFCHTYVDAQRDYAQTVGKGAYAQTFFSTPGKHNGLYWAAEKGAVASPLGPTVAAAAAEGYTHGKTRQPFHGYAFKVLTGQGANAPGGAHSYLVNGRMTRGFALVAWPVKYRSTGVMTFIVSGSGIVYQKDLGAKTAAAPTSVTSYNPDSSWTPVHLNP
jgi:hypothetical protein